MARPDRGGLGPTVLGERGQQDVLRLGDICEARSHGASLVSARRGIRDGCRRTGRPMRLALSKSANYRAASGRLPGHGTQPGFAVTAPTVVYDNTTNDNGNSIATGPDGATGSQVTLSGTARVVTDFLFGYVVDNDATATVKFWANDGPKGAPGTCLYSSGKIDVPAGNGAVKTLSSLSVEVPDTFTWTVRSQTVGLIGYGPATVGSFGPAWYSGPVRNENEQVIGRWWYQERSVQGRSGSPDQRPQAAAASRLVGTDRRPDPRGRHQRRWWAGAGGRPPRSRAATRTRRGDPCRPTRHTRAAAQASAGGTAARRPA